MKPSLHHLGILVADIAQTAQTYQARYHHAVVTDVIHDPVQTAYVQFLKGADGEPLIELVSPDGPESKLANALKKGAGLHHLCYNADDLEADCRRLRASGMVLLQSPVPAAAFPGRRIAWLMGRDRIPVELVESTASR